jgi:hypothetical protein
MRILSNEQVRTALQDFEPHLADAVKAAWSQASALFRKFRFRPTARCRSTTVQELIVQEVTARFPERMFQSRGRAMMKISPGLILQFKKLDRNGRPRNYPTPCALRFERQLSIEGMPDGTRATIGYQADDLGANLVDLAVVIQDELGVADRWPLREVIATVEPIQAPATAPPRRRARVRAGATKRGVAKRGSNGGEDPKG